MSVPHYKRNPAKGMPIVSEKDRAIGQDNKQIL